MTDLFRKLQLGDNKLLHVLNAPPSFDLELAPLQGVKVSRTSQGKTGFAMAFAITRRELDKLTRQLIAAADGDALLWVAYPKGTSKRYRCEFNRDEGWQVFAEAGYEPVRMVSLDEDWTALRFRHADRIKNLTRSRAISKTGQDRIEGTRITPKSPKIAASKKALSEKVSSRGFVSQDAYFAAQSPEALPHLQWIQKTTEALFPQANRCISYGMPAFRLKKMFLYFAAFQRHIGIYPPLRGDAALIRDLKPYLGPKGNLSFPLSERFPKALVKRVIVALAAERGGN